MTRQSRKRYVDTRTAFESRVNVEALKEILDIAIVDGKVKGIRLASERVDDAIAWLMLNAEAIIQLSSSREGQGP